MLLWKTGAFCSMQEGEGGGAAEAETKPWDEDKQYRTRANSPTKFAAKSNIWKEIKRLETGSDDKEAHPMVAEGKTHTCTLCGVFFKLAKNKGKGGTGTGSWVTSAAIDHAKDKHPETIGAEYIEAAAKLQVVLVLFCGCVLFVLYTHAPRGPTLLRRHPSYEPTQAQCS